MHYKLSLMSSLVLHLGDFLACLCVISLLAVHALDLPLLPAFADL